MSVFETGLNLGSYYGGGSTYTLGSCNTSYSGYGNSANNTSRLKYMSNNFSERYNLDLSNIGSDMGTDFVSAMRVYDQSYQDMKETAASYGYEMDDATVYTRMATAYQKANGSTVTADVAKHTKTSFATGFLEGIPVFGWLFANPYSKAEATEVVSGREAGVMEQVKECAGATVSTAATIGVLAGVAKVGAVTGALSAAAGGSGIVAGLASVGGGILTAAGAICTGILPLVGVAALIGTAVVIGKQALASTKA